MQRTGWPSNGAPFVADSFPTFNTAPGRDHRRAQDVAAEGFRPELQIVAHLQEIAPAERPYPHSRSNQIPRERSQAEVSCILTARHNDYGRQKPTERIRRR